jgi:DNA-binding Lrp family transcriptional regulator
MFKNESCSNTDIKSLNKYLCKTEAQFINRLHFWSSHKKEYGVEKWGRVWIYNTLDQWANQLGVSKSSIRRSIKSLKDKGIISSDYLSMNKRNRTLYYALNYNVLKKFISNAKQHPYVQNEPTDEHSNELIDEHVIEHIYNIDTDTDTGTYTKLNKSIKSNKSTKKVLEIENNSERSFSINDNKSKNTTAQDALAIWNEEMNRQDSLSKHVARYLVAAIQKKFENSLELWRKYLKRIKTSVYLMSEKFKIWIDWVLKFTTIDKILAGGFGTKEPPKSMKDQMAEAEAHIASLDEEPECLQIRRNFIEYHGPSAYMTWLTEVALRKITAKYYNGSKELLAVSMKSDALFEYFKTHHLTYFVTGGLEVDENNHFKKQECREEKTDSEMVEWQEISNSEKNEHKLPMSENKSTITLSKSSSKTSDFLKEIDDSGLEYASSMQSWQKRKMEKTEASEYGSTKTQIATSIGNCVTTLINDLSVKIPQLAVMNVTS